eukprot:5300529-Lingulodinium_polyedra.AAC.1
MTWDPGGQCQTRPTLAGLVAEGAARRACCSHADAGLAIIWLTVVQHHAEQAATVALKQDKRLHVTQLAANM